MSWYSPLTRTERLRQAAADAAERERAADAKRCSVECYITDYSNVLVCEVRTHLDHSHELYGQGDTFEEAQENLESDWRRLTSQEARA